MENISQIMNTLEKHFGQSSLTTLNRMRGKSDAFKILIACLLSLRTKDENTEKVCVKLFAVADTPEKIVRLPIKKLEKLIFSSGHYLKKARTLKHVSRVLIEEFDLKVPDDKGKLLSIKGIGPKTANIVLAFAFGQAVLPVDVHVHVTSNRLGFVKTKTPEQTEMELMKVVPKRFWKELNGIFVLFGKEICVTVSPKCSICPVRKYCPRIGIIRSR